MHELKWEYGFFDFACYPTERATSIKHGADLEYCPFCGDRLEVGEIEGNERAIERAYGINGH